MKAILEFDAPESCGKCQLLYLRWVPYTTSYFCAGNSTGVSCEKNGKTHKKISDKTINNKRAKFCPLVIKEDDV